MVIPSEQSDALEMPSPCDGDELEDWVAFGVPTGVWGDGVIQKEMLYFISAACTTLQSSTLS